MQVSQKQLEANRKNAQKSTGPKSQIGKQKVSRNAIKHGLYSDHIIIQSATYSENPEHYELLLASLLEELEPAGDFQLHLVKKIADCVWRSKRVVRAETAHINSQMDQIDADIRAAQYRKENRAQIDGTNDTTLTDEEHARTLQTSHGKRSLPDDSTSCYIQRCEMRLDRQLSRAYRLLNQLQDKARIDESRKKKEKKEKLPPGVSYVGERRQA